MTGTIEIKLEPAALSGTQMDCLTALLDSLGHNGPDIISAEKKIKRRQCKRCIAALRKKGGGAFAIWLHVFGSKVKHAASAKGYACGLG